MDDVGGQDIFPTQDIAGRQLYRIVYTAISFATLGTALSLYLKSLAEVPPVPHDSSVLQWIAALSWGCAMASLVNPSPLSLVPVYEPSSALQDADADDEQALVIRRDAAKLVPYGMTRITRHPLILPASSWAVATGLTMGGTSRDLAFFCLLYTSPSPRDQRGSRMPSSA